MNINYLFTKKVLYVSTKQIKKKSRTILFSKPTDLTYCCVQFPFFDDFDEDVECRFLQYDFPIFIEHTSTRRQFDIGLYRADQG